jgi:hypothetical protein
MRSSTLKIHMRRHHDGELNGSQILEEDWSSEPSSEEESMSSEEECIVDIEKDRKRDLKVEEKIKKNNLT